ncbi:MAG: CpaF family protein [bacterium]|nr:CpaF family protein [bacterium]
MEDEELLACIDSLLLEEARECYLPLESKIRLKKELFDRFRRLGLLQELVDDKEVSEIMVNGAKDIFIERGGKASRWDKEFEDEGQLEDLIQKMVSRVNRIVNRSTPICDARLEDGSRIHIVLPPIALNGPVLTIRKFPKVLSMKALIENETLTQEAALFLKLLVQAGYNIFVSGGTGCGKTTFLNALSEFIPPNSRVITIEDAAELQIRQVENLVRMETRNQNMEGEGEISMGQLIKAALRMNPDRIIVGEVRGKEAMDMLAAMNTGHDGSLSTGHANGPADMLRRLESMVLMGADLPLAAIRSQIASAVDVLVHIGRLRDKSRRVLSIMEVMGIEEGEIQLSPLFAFRETGKAKKGEKVEGSLFQVGELCHREKLHAAGDLL